MLNKCKLTEIEVSFAEDGDVANVDCDFKKRTQKKSSTEVEGGDGDRPRGIVLNWTAS